MAKEEYSNLNGNVKLPLDEFLGFMKDPANNIDNLKDWGLMPNEDPTPTKEVGGGKGTSKKDVTGAYNY